MRTHANPRRSLGMFLAASCACAASCDRETGISECRAPKGVEVIVGPEAGATGPGRAHAHSHTHDATVRWTIPEGWREVDPGPPPRLAVFEIDSAGGVVSVVVTRFPGDVGGVLANVNRWRAQVGVAPLGEEDLPGVIETFEIPGFRAYGVAIVNGDRATVAVGLEEPARSRTWFVKADTPSEGADRVREAVRAFARSFVAAQEQER